MGARLKPYPYRIMLSRKLRLPLLTDTPPDCRWCGKSIDPHGDHLFSCRFNKIHAHDSIRDTLCVILKQLGPLSGITNSSNDVQLEPEGLLPEHPAIRPADVLLTLASPTANGTKQIAIDVSLCSVSQSTLQRLRRSRHPKTLLDAHRRREFEKWNATGAAWPYPRDQVLLNLESRKIALVPFTIDHLGGIGSMAHQLLFQPSQAPFPAPLPTPANYLSSALFPPIHQRARNIQPHILTQATHHWKADNPIGTTHHSRSPVQWAMQVLSLNLTRAHAKHLCFHLDRCVQAQHFLESAWAE